MGAVRREGVSGGARRLVTLLIEPAGPCWEARAFGPALGANTGRRIGTYDDLDAAIREATDYGRQIEARGFEVHLRIKGREEQSSPTPPLPLPR